jgi:hypothetical protein
MMFLKKDAPRSRVNEWAWQDALFGAMIVVSVVGLLYFFTRR